MRGSESNNMKGVNHMKLTSEEESALNRIDRLGLAFCRLNCWEWDELLGKKPDGFDGLPDYHKRSWPWTKENSAKDYYIRPAIKAIESIIGPANISRCWWKFALGKSEEEWFQWYISECFRRRTT